MTCDVVTPEKKFFSAQTTFVVVPGGNGEMGVYSKHAPVVTTLGSGVVRIEMEGQGEPLGIAVSGGYAEIDGDNVAVLANRATLVSDIDAAAANARLEDLEAQLSALSAEDMGRAFVEDEIAWNRLLVHLKSD
jgi:F-type H+-transporting ATPase subunit epsilon